MSLICVHGLALFYVYNIFSFFFEHVGCFSFYALLQLHHENERKWTENTKKNFWCVQNIMPQCNCKPKWFCTWSFLCALMLMLCGNGKNFWGLLKFFWSSFPWDFQGRKPNKVMEMKAIWISPEVMNLLFKFIWFKVFKLVIWIFWILFHHC